MKAIQHRFVVLLVLLALTACGGAASPETGAPDQQPGATPAGTPCEQEIALQCEPGFVDGCLVAPTGEPVTLIHACIPESASIGPACVQEVAVDCPAGQRDGCLTAPPVSRAHVCVAVP